MARRYKRKTEGLDPETGNDYHMFPDKRKMLPELSDEVRDSVACAIFRWLAGGDETSVKSGIADPTAKFLFAVLVADQKNRVKEYIDFCNKSGPRKRKCKNKRKAGQSGLNRMKHKDKDMLSEEVLMLPTSSESAADRRVAVACAGSAPASAVSLGRRGAPPEKSKTEKMLDELFGED